MRNVVVDLDKEFPGCAIETKRQGIEQFACCGKSKIACDKMKICWFYRGIFHRKYVKKDTAVFVGTSGQEGGFVVVWFTMLPRFFQAKMPTDPKEFVGKLNARE